jgi:chromosome segregation ATPase
MKKFSFILFSFSLILSVASPAFAKMEKIPEASISMSKDEMKTMKEQRQEQRVEKKVGTLQERADREITRRIASLQKLLEKLNTLKRLSADQKASFTKQIQTEIDNLTALQAKIKANRDPATLKTDVQSIVTSYRIYALFMPKITILSTADRVDTIADQLSTLATKLQGRIDKAKSQGKDVTGLQADLSDMQKKIADAKTQEQNAVTSVTSLTPDGYPGNKTTLESARAMLQK